VTRRSRGAPTKALFAQQNVDFSKVEIKTTELGNKTYMLQGQGGNITVAVGTDGAIMVDSEFAPLHDRIKAAIEKISPLPIKYLIDTHYHGDHTGGNALFHKDGATSCSRSCSTQPADLGAVCPAPQCAVCAVRIHGCDTLATRCVVNGLTE
jgi:hypothetical protein